MRVNYILPVTFKLDEPAKESEDMKKAKSDKIEIWDIPETKPSFRGGNVALQQYIQDNLVIPEKYKNMEAKAEYRVLVQFVIAEDGTVTEVETVKPEPAKQDLNDEAVRVVKGMPKWSPGKVNGKCVKTKYVVPIVFKLGK